MVQDEQEKWDIVIKPRSGLFRLDLEEVWLYRDLLVMYIRRDIVTFYKQTVYVRLGTLADDPSFC